MDSIKYSAEDGIIDTYKDDHVGVKILSDNIMSLKMMEYYDAYYEDTSFYNWLTSNTIDSFFATELDDPIIVGGIAAHNLNAGDSITVYVAVSYGATKEEMTAGIAEAQAEFDKLTDVSFDDSQIPSTFILDQNYPNPFNPTTKIRYSIPIVGNADLRSVQLKVYDILGNEVATLVNKEQAAGSYEVDFNAAGLSSGMYFYSLTAGNFSSTKKMILIK